MQKDMETNLFKSINLIRRGSGVNLNLFRYAAMVIMLLTLGVGNAWGGNSDYYTKVTLSKNMPAAGKVYAQKGGTSGTWTENGATSAKDSQGSAPTHTWYLKVDVNNGYAFTGWESCSGWSSDPVVEGNFYKGSVTGQATTSPSAATATAKFVAVEVNSISETSHTFSNPINAQTTCGDYKKTITFTTKYADDMADFNISLSKTAGDGIFVFDGSPSITGNTVTATVKFTGNDRYAATPGGARTNTATLTLTSKGSESQTKTCNFTATFPSASVTSGKLTVSGAESDLYATNTNPVNGNVEFAVKYADALGDFTLPATVTEKSHSGDTWSIGTITGPNTNYETGAGKIVIPITFTSEEGKYGDHTAKITLGGVTVTMTAHVEELADYDVKVVDADGTTVLHKGAWGDDAFSALNGHAGSTLIVGRDFNIGSVSSARAISQNVTLDLNGKAVTATLTAAGSLLNVTSGKTLTIGGVKGGSLSVTGNVAGRIAIVEVQNGSLNLQRGDLEITNSNSGNGTESNPYAAGVYLASRAWSGGKPTVTMAMSGGSITAKRTAGGHGYGICCAGSGNTASSIDLTGGTITAEVPNGTYALGVYVSGHSNISNMTINASSSINPYAIFTGASDAKVVISSGTYSSVSTGANPRALLTRGNVSVLGGTFTTSGTTGAYGLFVSNGTAVINAGSFSATATAGVAYGLGLPNGGAHTAKVNGGSFSATGTTAAYAANTTANTTLITTAGTFTAEASGTNTDVKAYGLNVVANATADVSGATFSGITTGAAAVTGSSANSQPKGAYGIFNQGNLTVTNSTLNGQSAKVYAYGLYTNQSVTLTESALNAETNAENYATALYINGSGKTVTANNCSFNAISNTTYAYGVYAYAGDLVSKNSDYYAKTKQTGATAAAGSYGRGIYNNANTTLTLTGGTITCTGDDTYSQNSYGLYTAGTAVVNGTEITCNGVKSGYALYAYKSGAQMTVNSGKFKGTSGGLYIDTNNKPGSVKLYGGFYNSNTNLKTYKATGCEVYDVPSEMIEKGKGYSYMVADGSAPGVIVAKVYNGNGTLQQSYKTLAEALQFVNANSGTQYTIVMVANYVLPAGEYTLPNKAMLVVPDVITRTKAQITQTSEDNKVNRVVINTPAPTLAVKLTMADGANLTAYGTIEATANQAVSNGGQLITGATTGPYGQIEMNAGSSIQLESGSRLVCWGYITGKGQITANRGSKIYEHFQLGYWRGGSATKSMINNRNTYHAFPVTDYFYQNIEAPILYRPGADAYGYTGINYTLGVETANNIHLVGTSGAMFLMDNSASEENTWIRKEYDPTTDRVEWKMNSGAKLGDFSFSMILTVNSADYYLPITNNMTIIIEDGECEITQDAVLLPGAKIIINKTAKLVISSGKKLFCVDADDWSKVGSYYFYTALYSPSWASPSTCPRNHGTTSAPIKEADAEIFVHGETEGWYYTTAHGANIHSTNADAGKVKFIADAGSETTMKQCTSTGPAYVDVDFTSAKLKNEIEVESSYYTQTTSAKAGYAYIYEDQQWIYVHDGCLTTRTDATGTHYYARPGDNVAVLENEDDAAYHGESEANRDRNFIFTEKSMGAGDAAKCVWWEATKIGDIDGDGKIYYMANQEKYDNYGAYYYYDSEAGYWKSRYVSITWDYEVDGAAKSATYDKVFYHTSPLFTEFSNPHKKDDASYSYNWTGWTDEDGLFYAKDNELPLATKNITYTAKFEAVRLQGSVSFKDYNGADIESGLLYAGTVPACTKTIRRSSDVDVVYTFDGWSTSAGGAKAYEIDGLPEVVAKTTVTYYAHYATSPRAYAITFTNYNGDVVQIKEFDYDTNPTYDGADPTRANSGFWSYDFIGWEKDETFYAKGATLPIVKGVATYTAQYEAVDWTPEYTITFKDGDNKVLTTQTARLNAVPEYAGVTPTKTATAQYIYSFNNTWSPAIVAATKNETYTAQFDSELRSYTITFCNETGRELSSATFDYGATPVYGGETPKKARTGSAVYTFDGWSSIMGGAKLDELPSVSKAATYYAHFSDEPVYVVRFNAQGHGTAPANQEVIRGNKVTEPNVPTEAGYVFGGWYKEVGCTTAWNFDTDVVTANTTLYANWTPVNYNLTYEGLNGATNSNPATYTVETKTITLADPGTRTGYTFNGWTCGGSPITQITLGSTGNKTITANWTANTNTAYTVKHYQQNLDGSYPSEPTEIQNLNGTTGANVTPEVMNYEGFTAPSTQTKAIAADGTMVVEYQYTRNSYTLTWNLDGGSISVAGTPAGSVKYGTALVAPTVVKTGYTFASWSPAKAEAMPAAATEYTATWTPNTNTVYTVKHYKQNLAGDGYDLADTDNLTGTTGASVTPAVKSYTGFTAPGTQTVTVLADGSRVVEYQYTRNNCNLSWSANGGNVLTGSYTTGSVKYGASITAPNDPTRTGYSFSGWSPAYTGTMPATNTEYQAQWTPEKSTVTWKDGTTTIKIEEWNYDSKPSFNYVKTPTAQYSFPLLKWEDEDTGVQYDPDNLPVVKNNVTYVAICDNVVNKYTIRFVNDGGTILQTINNIEYGTLPVYTEADPSSEIHDYYIRAFKGWNPEIVEVAGHTTYTALYDTIAKLEIKEEYVVPTTTIVETTTVEVGGSLNVANEKKLTTTDLIIEGSADEDWEEITSGEVVAVESAIEAYNAYYDMKPAGGYKARIWYAVAVPWTVDVPTGVAGHVYDANGHALRLNIDFDLLYYDGAQRAAGGTNNWRYVAQDAAEDQVMKPGKAYMIYLATPTSKLRFEKSSGNWLTKELPLEYYPLSTGDYTDANWNGIANPAIYRAYLNAGTDGNWGQVFVPGSAPRDGGTYAPVDMSTYKLAVGQPIFVQAENTEKETVVAYQSNTDYTNHAPRRAQADAAEQEARYAVEIAVNGKRGDRIFIATDDDKEDAYTIGSDVVKMGWSSTKPQMWINRYGSKLCVNTVEFHGSSATYPLMIQIPSEGEYSIYTPSEILSGHELYITYNGRAIWNLSYAPFEGTFAAGTHAEYGLKLVRSKLPTDIEQTNAGQEDVRKVLIDDHVYIIRGGAVFSIDGQLVK